MSDDQEQRENDLRDRIALLEQRNGALDADLMAAGHAREQAQAVARAVDRQAALAYDAKAAAEDRVAELIRKVERLANEKVALQERLDTERRHRTLLQVSLDDARREANTAHAQVDTAAEASAAWSEVHGTLEGTTLLEAQGGVFVPVPAGHMLSVTVTPYDDSGETEPVAHHPACVKYGDDSGCRPCHV